jgi:hypothetical protein
VRFDSFARPGPARARRVGLACALALVALPLHSCGMFTPTKPVISTTPTVNARYSSVTLTLQTVADAVADKGVTNGLDAYLAAFADTSIDGRAFAAFFDTTTINRLVNAGKTPVLDWNRDRERTFYVQLSIYFPLKYLMEWDPDPDSPDDEISSDGLETIAHRHYTIAALTTGQDPHVFARGYADLTLRVFATRWKIVKWQDREDPQANVSNEELCIGHYRQQLLK